MSKPTSQPSTRESSVSGVELGRRLRAARTVAGYDRMTDFATAIGETTGSSISARTLYAIERGEQMPSFEQMVSILVTLPEAEQQLFFQSAIREDLRRRLWFNQGSR